ncbi:hypothetical protein CDL12_04404 [Handroanthus impetiginosus]|uniref:Uncharacterized protein n=1 Tax=Handroanthus impetiginosus TaxID=429701 RepID=A0A2G9HZE4_9LAMI|nr:hypothetical protein CDL12_04404 [Handroanthus impetiginosus]
MDAGLRFAGEDSVELLPLLPCNQATLFKIDLARNEEHGAHAFQQDKELQELSDVSYKLVISCEDYESKLRCSINNANRVRRAHE